MLEKSSDKKRLGSGLHPASQPQSNQMPVPACQVCNPANARALAKVAANYFPNMSEQQLLTSAAGALLAGRGSNISSGDYRRSAASVIATKNLTVLNSHQVDVRIQPKMFLDGISAEFLPEKVDTEPLIVTFDEDGTSPSLDPGVTKITASFDQYAAGTKLLLGYLAVGKRYDLFKSVGSLSVKTNVYNGSFDISNNDDEFRLAIMCAKPSHNDSQTVTLIAADGSLSVRTTSTQLTDVFDLCVGDQTCKQNNVEISGVNVYLKLYPVILTKRTFQQFADRLMSDRASWVVADMLNYR